MARVIIAGVGIQLEELKDKTFDEISEMDIFSHIPKDDKADAYDKLFDEIEKEKYATCEHIQENTGS